MADGEAREVGESGSSVRVAINGKGEPSVEAKVYEGSTIIEVDRIRTEAVRTAVQAYREALIDLGKR